MIPAFTQITETPGLGATREQLAMLATRYALAARHAAGGPVLEVACGTGIGLGLLADAGARVMAVDIDPENVRRAQATWRGDARIRIDVGDAASLAQADGSCAAVVCFEALYYFPDIDRCLTEMVRVLRPGGTLVLCSVNPGWSGFNRSPFAGVYPTPATLSPLLMRLGCRVEAFAGFADQPGGMVKRLVGGLRRVAIRRRLIPGSMRGKQLLKKLFLGGTVPMPARLTPATAQPEPLTALPISSAAGPWKVFYLTAVKAA